MKDTVQVYNTFTRSKEPLIPLTSGEIRMYVCGVTVYDLCHVGHARSAIVFDVIRRYLAWKGYRVKFVKNYTDIDDKIIRRANDENVRANVVSERNIRAFKEDMAAIGVLPGDVEPKATDHVPEMLALIERLIAGGFAYVVDGDVYFEIRRFARYGQLSGKNLDELLAGARVDVDERKHDPRDFALWKSAKPGEPEWDSPWGKGRPGWHIECSAMSMKYLGASFDIHGGGEDLIFPHHECEIAQSEAATQEPFARYWLHNGFVNFGAEKMSKSLGNTFTIRRLRETVSADALRMWVVRVHYRSLLPFSELHLTQTEHSLEKFRSLIREVDPLSHRETQEHLQSLEALEIHQTSNSASSARLGLLTDEPGVSRLVEELTRLNSGLGQSVAMYYERFKHGMDDDFNTAEAVGALYRIQHDVAQYRYFSAGSNKPPDRAAYVGVTVLLALARVLGLFQDDPSSIPLEIQELVRRRSDARAAKNWKQSDELRSEIDKRGWSIEDTPAGPRLSRKTE